MGRMLMRSFLLALCLFIFGCTHEVNQKREGGTFSFPISELTTETRTSEPSWEALRALRFAALSGYPEAIGILAFHQATAPDAEQDALTKRLLSAAEKAFANQLAIHAALISEAAAQDTLRDIHEYTKFRLAFLLRAIDEQEGLIRWQLYTGQADWPMSDMPWIKLHSLMMDYALLSSVLGRRMGLADSNHCLRHFVPTEEEACELLWPEVGYDTDTIQWHAGHLREMFLYAADQGHAVAAYMVAASQIYDLPFITDVQLGTNALSRYHRESYWVGDNESGWRIRDTRREASWPNGPNIDGAIETLRPYSERGDWYAALGIAALRGEGFERDAFVRNALCAAKRTFLVWGKNPSFLEAIDDQRDYTLAPFPRSGPFFDKWEAAWIECRL